MLLLSDNVERRSVNVFVECVRSMDIKVKALG